MEWTEKLQQIIEYVEVHLQRDEEPVDPDEVARMAGCSYGFFQKVFSYMNGISFADYIRARKLTLAGYDIKSSQMKVIDISYRYGYDSPTSFTKAFLNFHGVTPSAARASSCSLRVYPKMKLLTQERYSWRLEKKEALRMIGKVYRLSTKNQEHHKRIPALWNDIQRSGDFAKMIEMDESPVQGLFGGYLREEKRLEIIEYGIFVLSGREVPKGFTELEVPSLTWAVFDCKGVIPKAIVEGWNYLQEEWLVHYPFAHADCPEFEWYSAQNPYDEEYLSQIWIPVIEEV